MNPRFEQLFRLWEERDMEVDPEMRKQLQRKLHEEIELFLRENGLLMPHDTFFHTVRDDYKNWRRNKH